MGECAQGAKEPQIDMVISTLIKTVRENLELIALLDNRLCAPSPENMKDMAATKPTRHGERGSGSGING